VTKKFVDFKAFLPDVFQSALGAGRPVLHLILDNGPPPAPKPLASWLASGELAFEVRREWLPTSARWLDQVEIIFRKVQRDVLTPSDFARTLALARTLHAYFPDRNPPPNPIEWTDTQTTLFAKFGQPPPPQLAA